MGIKINYDRVAQDAEEMISCLDNFRRDLDRFRSSVGDYASTIQDNISSESISLCDEIETVIKEARKLIIEMNEHVSEGMNLLSDTQKDIGGKISNI